LRRAARIERKEKAKNKRKKRGVKKVEACTYHFSAGVFCGTGGEEGRLKNVKAVSGGKQFLRA